MANQLTMADIQAILTLHKRGWRNRRIARELNIDRETVAKYIRASSLRSKTSQSAHRLGDDRSEQAAEGRESPLPTLDSHQERGIEASPSSLLAGGDGRRFKTSQSAHRLRGKTSQSAARIGGGFGPPRSGQAIP